MKSIKLLSIILSLILFLISNLNSQPVVNSYTINESNGEKQILISGSNFSGASNIVYMGSSRINTLSESSNLISGTLAGGEKFSQISVTNMTTNLTGTSSGFYFPTFNGNGNTNVTVSEVKFLPHEPSVWQVKIADFDFDGLPDVAAINQTGHIYVYKNTSDYNELSVSDNHVQITDDVYNKSICVADIDNDGKLDIISAGASWKINVHLNTSNYGIISFNSKSYQFNGNQSDNYFSVTDMDGDGKADIVFDRSGATSKLAILRNTSTPGSVSFDAPVNINQNLSGWMKHFTCADLNNDGKQDIVSTSPMGGANLEILLNSSTPGNFSFTSWGNLTSVSGTYFAHIADIDADGKNDVIASCSGNSYLYVWRNNLTDGVLSFDARYDKWIGDATYGAANNEELTFADMNGDGKLDIIAGTHGMANIYVRNTSTPGSIVLQNKTFLSGGSWYHSGRRLEAADLDMDGRPDLVYGNNGTGVYINKNTSSISSPPDAGIIGISNPTNPGCDGEQDIKVTIKNYSLNPLTSVNVRWSVNGAPTTLKQFSNLNIPGNGEAVVTLESFPFSQGTYWIVAYTSMPDGVSDNNQTNDSYTDNNIVINSTPVANAGIDQYIIAGQSATLTVSGGSTHSWNTGANTATIVVSPNVTTTYTGYAHNANCSGSDQVIVYVTDANTWTGNAHTTSWNTPGNWSGNIVPTSTINVNIPTSPAGGNYFPVINTETAECKNLTILAGASISVPINKTLNIYGDLNNNGSANLGQGTICFKGSVYQNIYGSSNFNNLTINSSNTVFNNWGQLNLTGILKLTSGTFVPNGLTLKSNASKTAIISGTGSGTLSGAVEIERYLGNIKGYHYICNPLRWGSINDISDNINIQGYGNSYSTGGWSNVWKYDETDISQTPHDDGVRMNGWVAPETQWDLMESMRGFAIYTNPNQTINFYGEPNNGEFSINLTHTSSLAAGGNSEDDGWNFIGNPYPCPIDWDAISGWTRNNVDDAIYSFEPTNAFGGSYRAYVNGIGIPSSVNSIISPMQGFFVHCSENSTLSINNSARVDIIDSKYYKKTNDKQIIKINLTGTEENAKSDETAIYFEQNADMNFNKSLDAVKFMNTDSEMPNIYTALYKKNYAIKAISLNQDLNIPIGINLPKEGNYNLKFNLPDALSAFNISLVDLNGNIVKQINNGSIYEFESGNFKNEVRFYLRISKDNQVNAKGSVMMISENGLLKIVLSDKQGSNAKVKISNVIGQVIQSKIINNGTTTFDLPKGIYLVNVESDTFNTTKKIYNQD